MVSRLTKASLIAAAVGAAMQVLATVPAEAFTLGATSPAPIVAGADIDHVWWDRWHRWHHNWGGPGPGPGPYWGWHHHWMHCWYGPWGRRCG